MTTAPAADQRRLLDVQTLDTRLDQLAHKRRTLPELARLAELEAQLDDLYTALVTSQTAVSDLRREVTLSNMRKERVKTPFGDPSDAFVLGELEGRRSPFWRGTDADTASSRAS